MSKNMNFQKNWAGNLQYNSKQYFQPETVEQIQELIKNSKRVKTLGSRHCFNGIADCDETHLSLSKMNKMLSVDENSMTVKIEGGAQYSDFCSELNEAGFALPNLASLANISVVGACATATHGSGVNNQSLASSICEIEFIDGRGEIVKLNRQKDAEIINGAIVNLGALGVITKLTLDIKKSYQVRQDLFENLSFEQLSENFEEITSSGYSVSLFTQFQNKTVRVVNIKRRVDEAAINLPTEFFGATAAKESINSRGIPDINRSPQMGVSGCWFECLPHFKFSKNLIQGEELQSEYYVEKKNAVDAILALDKINNIIFPQILIAEIRTIRADEHWLSPFYRGDSVGIHFSWKLNEREVMKILPEIEKALSPCKPIPHWGKLFTTSREDLHSHYPRMQDFIALANEFDPNGKFRNDYLNRYIF